MNDVPVSGDTWEYEVAEGGGDELNTSLWGLESYEKVHCSDLSVSFAHNIRLNKPTSVRV
jgi:hypothetical protein